MTVGPTNETRRFPSNNEDLLLESVQSSRLPEMLVGRLMEYCGLEKQDGSPALLPCTLIKRLGCNVELKCRWIFLGRLMSDKAAQGYITVP